jgi:CRISPR-associated protein Cas5t
MVSYPLAPPSTVYGLLRHITGYLPINPETTRIGITGSSKAKMKHIVRHAITTKTGGTLNVLPMEELVYVTHNLYVSSQYEEEIRKNVNLIQRFGRSEDIVVTAECETIKAISTAEAYDLQDKKLNVYDRAEMAYAPFKGQNEDKVVFRMAIDTVKEDIDAGRYRAIYGRFFYMSSVQLSMTDDESICHGLDSNDQLVVFSWLT